jgi:L-threonylcarbamoyladenylate synthase
MHIESVSTERAIAFAAEAIRDGGIIIYPTDTLYGLGADALSDEAVAKIYAIKGRDPHKPIHAIVDSLEMAERYAHLNGTARVLAKNFLPGPLTLILKKKTGIDTGIAKGIATFGIRIPDNAFCIALARAYGAPITTTSANMSGMQPERTVEKILAQMIGADIALVVDAGEIPMSAPSTVVDCSGERPLILREGAISANDIWMALAEY